MNPEFVRNKWLELTPLRLWALPLVVLALAVVFNAFDHQKAMNGISWGAMRALGLTLIGVFASWGAYNAAQAVTSEVIAGTWDQQILAQHKAWELLVGKLFGSTVYAWLGVALGMALFALSSAFMHPPAEIAQDVVVLTLSVACLFTLGLFGSLASAATLRAVRRPSTQRGQQTGMMLVVAMVVLCTSPAILSSLAGGKLHDEWVFWWWGMWAPTFLALSLALFIFWTLIVSHRLVRAELQESVSPVGWIGFLLFLAAYGFPLMMGGREPTPIQPATAYFALQAFICAALFYPLLLGERKDLVRARSLAAAWSRSDGRGVWTRLPLWTFNLAGFGLSLVGMAITGVIYPSLDLWVLVAVSLSFGLFMMRDLAWVLAVHLAPTPGRRPDLVVWFFLAVLYLLIPAVFAALGEGTIYLAYLFVPAMPPLHLEGDSAAEALLSVLWALPGVLVAGGIAWARLRKTLTL